MKISIDKSATVYSFDVEFPAESGDSVLSEPSQKRPISEENQASAFAKIFEEFCDGSGIYLYTNPLVRMMLLALMMNVTNKQIEEFCVANGVLVEQADKISVYSVPTERILDFYVLVKNFRSAGQLLESTDRNLLIQLSTQFDILVSDLARALLEADHALYDNSDRQVDLVEVLKFESMLDFRMHLLDKATETVIRKGREEQFKWLEKKIDRPLTKDLPNWNSFIELNERRNLFTHTRGLVTQNYLSACSRLGLDVADLQVGDVISADESYSKKAAGVCFVIGVKLIQVIWRIRCPSEMILADMQ